MAQIYTKEALQQFVTSFIKLGGNPRRNAAKDFRDLMDKFIEANEEKELKGEAEKNIRADVEERGDNLNKLLILIDAFGIPVKAFKTSQSFTLGPVGGLDDLNRTYISVQGNAGDITATIQAGLDEFYSFVIKNRSAYNVKINPAAGVTVTKDDGTPVNTIPPKTTVYIIATDTDEFEGTGNFQYADPLAFKFTTEVTQIGPDRATVRTQLNKSGSFFYVITPEAETQPSKGQIENGQRFDNNPGLAAGTITPATEIQSSDLSGLPTPNTTYELYGFARSGTEETAIINITFTTIADVSIAVRNGKTYEGVDGQTIKMTDFNHVKGTNSIGLVATFNRGGLMATPITGVTYGGVAMTKLAFFDNSYDYPNHIQLWAIKLADMPADGLIEIIPSGGSGIENYVITACLIDDIDQTLPALATLEGSPVGTGDTAYAKSNHINNGTDVDVVFPLQSGNKIALSFGIISKDGVWDLGQTQTIIGNPGQSGIVRGITSYRIISNETITLKASRTVAGRLSQVGLILSEAI